MRDIRSRAALKVQDIVKKSPFYRPPEELPSKQAAKGEMDDASSASEVEAMEEEKPTRVSRPFEGIDVLNQRCIYNLGQQRQWERENLRKKFAD